MTTIETIELRLAKLEARAASSRPLPTRDDAFPTPSPEVVRAVLEMLVEAGALALPQAGAPDRWRDLRVVLFGPDGCTANDSHDAMEQAAEDAAEVAMEPGAS